MLVTVADLTALLTPQGQELLARLANGQQGSPLALAERLRREYPAGLVALAMAQRELRRAAAAKFSRAAEMLFTRAGYEQSSSEAVARYRASRLDGALPRDAGRVADLCCGIGGDLIALAAASEVLAVDKDEVHVRLALHNAGVYGLAGRVTAVVSDVRDVRLDGIDAAFIDPARRAGPGTASAGTARRFRAGLSEPPLDWCAGLTDQVAAVCVKAAPGLPADLIPPGWEAEFIAEGRDLKEAVLWSPALVTAPVAAPPGVPPGPRRATIIATMPGGRAPDAGAPDATGPVDDASRAKVGPSRAQGGTVPSGHATLVAAPGGPVPLRAPGEYLLDPNPAVTRAGLVEDLARALGGDIAKIDPRIAFLTLDRPVETPFARTLRVLESAPWHEKRFAVRLRELGIGAVDIRRRGLAGDVDQIRRRLKLKGTQRATLVITRVDDRPWGVICAGLAPLPQGLAAPQQDTPYVGRLPDVLHVVVEHGDQPHAEGHVRGPPGVDHAVKVVVGELGHELDRLRGRLLVVLGEQARGRGRGRDGGDLLWAVTVPVVRHPGRQPEPRRPATGRPYLRHAERGREVVVLHPGEVPDQPAHRVGAGVDPVGELPGRQPVKHVSDVFPDPPEPVDKQLRTSSHAAIISPWHGARPVRARPAARSRRSPSPPAAASR